MDVKVTRVLHATDLSQHAAHMLQYAYRFTYALGGQLFVLHTIDPERELLAAHALGSTRATPTGAYLRLHEERLAEIKRISAGLTGVTLETIVARGVPHCGIREAVDRHRIDLLIIGSHGRGSDDYTELGGTARRVLRGACCPVLMLKPSDFCRHPCPCPCDEGDPILPREPDLTTGY